MSSMTSNRYCILVTVLSFRRWEGRRRGKVCILDLCSQTAGVVQLWRSEKRDKGHLFVEMKKMESKEVGGAKSL